MDDLIESLPSGMPLMVAEPARQRIYHLICQALSGEMDAPHGQGLSASEWDLFSRMAEAEGVAPLLYWKGSHSGRWATAPDIVRAQLSAAYYGSAGYNLLLSAELSRILAAFQVAAIPVVVLKGAALVPCLYPDPALRPMNDLDLLVPPGALDDALSALHRCGFFIQNVTHHVTLIGGATQEITVELHWSVGVSQQAHLNESARQWFWQRTQAFTLPAGSEGLSFQPAAQLLYLAAHLILKHGAENTRLIWFHDIHLLVERYQEQWDWEAVIQSAAELGCLEVLAAALSGACQRFRTALPQEVLQELLLHDPGTPMDGKAAGGPANSIHRKTWDALLLLDLHLRLRLAWRLFLPSPAYMRWRYRPQPAWLWPLYYPSRWWDFLKSGFEGRKATR